MTLTRYDDPFDPEDYADFESIEDRDDLADLPLDLEPCDDCGTPFSIRGAFGRLVVLECRICDVFWNLELGSDEELEEEEESFRG